MSQLDKYGEMLLNLSIEISNDLQTKSNDELLELENECKSITNTNCTWTNYRISKTVLESVTYEIEQIRRCK